MSDAKIEFKLGAITFAGEGEPKWLAEQLSIILDQAPNLLQIAPAQVTHTIDVPQEANTQEQQTTTLANFLKSSNVGKNQNRRFLATAAWLRSRGNDKPTTAEVSKALKENHQPKLSNPSHCLNQNVQKGFCEKDGKHFFVTPEGLNEIGTG